VARGDDVGVALERLGWDSSASGTLAERNVDADTSDECGGIVAVFGTAREPTGLSRAVVDGPFDWERSSGGCVQEHDRPSFEANGSPMAGSATESDGESLCRPLQRTMETLLEHGSLIANKTLLHPSCCIPFQDDCKVRMRTIAP